jgi:hypothetical protein
MRMLACHLQVSIKALVFWQPGGELILYAADIPVGDCTVRVIVNIRESRGYVLDLTSFLVEI